MILFIIITMKRSVRWLQYKCRCWWRSHEFQLGSVLRGGAPYGECWWLFMKFVPQMPSIISTMACIVADNYCQIHEFSLLPLTSTHASSDLLLLPLAWRHRVVHFLLHWIMLDSIWRRGRSMSIHWALGPHVQVANLHVFTSTSQDRTQSRSYLFMVLITILQVFTIDRKSVV